MITEEAARKQLQTLHEEGTTLAKEFSTEQREREKLYPRPAPRDKNEVRVTILRLGEAKPQKAEPDPEPIPPEKTRFEERYQSWYSRTLPLMKQLAQDRYAEFQSFYVVDPRYPWGDKEAYVIQDFFRGRESDDPSGDTVRCFKTQLNILKSIRDRLEWQSLATEDHLERGLQLALLETARGLLDVDPRAAGALAGTVLEAHLKKLALKHKLRFRQQAPSPRDFVEALKTAKVLDVPAWSQVTWLTEIQARCLAKGEPPTKLQIRDLIDGTRWLITNVF